MSISSYFKDNKTCPILNFIKAILDKFDLKKIYSKNLLNVQFIVGSSTIKRICNTIMDYQDKKIHKLNYIFTSIWSILVPYS